MSEALSIEQIRQVTPESYRYLFGQQAFKKWIDEKTMISSPDIRLSSMALYIPRIGQFLDFAKLKSTDDFIQQVQYAVESKDTKEWTETLDNWFKQLVFKEGLTRKYAREKIVTIIDFLSKFKINLDYRLPSIGKAKTKAAQFELTFDILREAVLSTPANDPLRLFMLIMKDSGLSEMDVLNLDLNYRHHDPVNDRTYPSLADQMQNPSSFYLTIAKNRYKTGVPTLTFLGPESSYTLITRRKYFLNENRLFPWTTVRGVEKRFKTIKDVLGKPHLYLKSIRSLFDTTIESPGENGIIKTEIAEIMMGHEISDQVRRAYLRYGPKPLEDVYVSKYNDLRLFPKSLEGQAMSLTRDQLS
ncbi:MAG: hypothetical protein KGN01_06830 [Patescibacteria group bacterium]|nr:hypothetical protein [Patescibacteria group bacterium]